MVGKEDVLGLHALEVRGLTKEELMAFYTEEELKDILKPLSSPFVPLSDTKYETKVLKEREEMAKKGKYHKWTYYEDKFLKLHYKHLSDNMIGLAFNLPARFVAHRRRLLGLKKGNIESAKIIVWCNRQDFEKDCEKFQLTKLRGCDE